MSKQNSDIIPHGKERLKEVWKEVYGYDLSDRLDSIPPENILKFFTETDLFDELTMNQALHKESAKTFYRELFKIVEEASGIDLKKERDLSERRYKEFMVIVRKGFEVYKRLTNELEKFNKIFSDQKLITTLKKFEIFAETFKNFKKVDIENTKMSNKSQKEIVVEKKDPFEVMVPKNFWEEIFEEDLFNEDNDY